MYNMKNYFKIAIIVLAILTVIDIVLNGTFGMLIICAIALLPYAAIKWYNKNKNH